MSINLPGNKQEKRVRYVRGLIMECSVHDCNNQAEIGCFCQECYNLIDAPESEPIVEIQSDGLIITYD